ncbi:hypothetical protein BGZ99_004845 [Dissophora globulifera]|uniref:DASH complex subunit DAD1 n=1 Tax=Dissophora globulifera TaxID=979702 RepID=A0A9P6RJC8_9FUNG|nr:hypothetical protein BGZ99_004845 [Dissophora globulifera]
MAIMQGSNGQTTESASFEAERTRLITDIKLEMGQVIANFTILNRNLETIATVGQEFEQLAQLWKHFHTSAFQHAQDDIYQSQHDT